MESSSPKPRPIGCGRFAPTAMRPRRFGRWPVPARTSSPPGCNSESRCAQWSRGQAPRGLPCPAPLFGASFRRRALGATALGARGSGGGARVRGAQRSAENGDDRSRYPSAEPVAWLADSTRHHLTAGRSKLHGGPSTEQVLIAAGLRGDLCPVPGGPEDISW